MFKFKGFKLNKNSATSAFAIIAFFSTLLNVKFFTAPYNFAIFALQVIPYAFFIYFYTFVNKNGYLILTDKKSGIVNDYFKNDSGFSGFLINPLKINPFKVNVYAIDFSDTEEISFNLEYDSDKNIKLYFKFNKNVIDLDLFIKTEKNIDSVESAKELFQHSAGITLTDSGKELSISGKTAAINTLKDYYLKFGIEISNVQIKTEVIHAQAQWTAQEDLAKNEDQPATSQNKKKYISLFN